MKVLLVPNSDRKDPFKDQRDKIPNNKHKKSKVGKIFIQKDGKTRRHGNV